MKLNLNKTLRAALIAAISTAGFTLTQAQAWDGGPEDDFGGKGHVYYTRNGETGVSLTDTSRDTFWITGNAQSTTASIASVTAKNGALVHISGTNGWHSDYALTALTIENIQASSADGAITISTQPFSSSAAASSTNVNINGVGSILAGVDNYGIMTLGTTASTINASGTLANHDGASLTLNGTFTFDTAGIEHYTLKAIGNTGWTDTEHEQGFVTSQGSSYYVIKGVTAGTFTAQAKDGTTQIKQDGSDYYFVAADVVDTSKFYVKNTTATLDRSGTGQIIVEGGGQGGTVTVANGVTYRDTSGSKNLNIVVDNGGVLEITHSGGNGYVTGNITIKGGGTFRVAGQHDAFGWGGGTTKNIILQGEEGKIATLDFQQTSSNSATFNAALKMMGYASITGAKGFNTHDGSFYAEGKMNSIESFQIRHAATFEVKEGGELTVGTMTTGQDGNKTLTKTGKGTMTFTTKAQAEGLVINEGAIVINGGTENSFKALTIAADGTLTVADGTLSVSGNSNVVSNTIAIGATGNLNLAGTYDVSGITADGVVSYEGSDVLGTDNGFKKTSGKVQVLKLTEGGQFSQEAATVNYGGTAYKLDATGAIELAGTPDYTTLYVNTESVSFDTAWGIAEAAGKEVGAVVMAADTTLNADKAGTTITLAMNGDATVNASAATTISSITGWQDNTLTIKGAGAVTLPNQTLTLTGSTALDVQGNVASKKIALDSNSAALNVAAGATLAIDGNLTPTHGSVNINGTVNISGELDLSNGSKSDVALQIGSTGKVTANGMWMRHDASIKLAAGGEYDIAKLAIVGKENGSITFTPTSGDASYGTNNSNFVISNAKVTATGDVTIGNTLTNSDVVTGAHTVTLNSAPDSVTVSEGGKMVVNTELEGLALQATGGVEVTANGYLSLAAGSVISNVVTNNGAVDLTGVTLSQTGGFTEQGGGTGYYDVAGNETTEEQNHYLGTNSTYVQVVSNGDDAEAIGTGIDWKGTKYALQDDGTIVIGSGTPTYDTFYIVTGSESISNIAKNKTNAIEVSAGTLVIDEAASGIDITVKDEGTITGDKADAKQVKIAAGATAFYTGDVEDSGVTFTPVEGYDSVIISNNNEAGTAKAYSIADKDLSVAAHKLEMTAEDNVTVSNAVVMDELVNTTGKVLTLDNTDALLLINMNITGSTVELSYVNEDQQVAEGVVSVAGILQGGQAALMADLTLFGGSTLDVNGGDTNALTLGSTLTVDYASGLIKLDDATLSALNAMNEGDTLKLIVAADQTMLEYGGESGYDGMGYDQMFNRAGTQGVELLGNFTVYAQGDAFGLTKLGAVPEPTTGTLSLLALAALAARRRRK